MWQTDQYWLKVIQDPDLAHYNDTNTEELHLIFRSWTIAKRVKCSSEVKQFVIKFKWNCQKQKQQIWATDANAANHRRESDREAGLMRVVVQSKPSPICVSQSVNSASFTGRSGRSVISVTRSCVLIKVSEATLSLMNSVEWRWRVNFSPVASTSIPTPLLAAILAVWHPRTRSLVLSCLVTFNKQCFGALLPPNHLERKTALICVGWQLYKSWALFFRH